MIFRPEMVEKILAGKKTVTRRPVKYVKQPHPSYPSYPLPCRYEVGRDYAMQPVIEDGPGKGRGGKEVGRLLVMRVDRRPLGGSLDWSISEAHREGFENWLAFRNYWIGLYGSYDPTQLVDRIEFELVPSEEALK